MSLTTPSSSKASTMKTEKSCLARSFPCVLTTPVTLPTSSRTLSRRQGITSPMLNSTAPSSNDSTTTTRQGMIPILTLTQTPILASIIDIPPTPVTVEGTTMTNATATLIAGTTAMNLTPIVTKG